ncbi:response regulator transcription factor [Xanthobacter flavus]|uniref:response regulator transcription factor n=1 Tax=Xanthobacter flavus TaxID=281 RepID=UPI0037270E0B
MTMPLHAPDDEIVHVVDDDDAFRDSLVWLIEAKAHHVVAHASAEAFLDACRPGMVGCLVVDVRMPGLSGIQLHARLGELGIELPTIVVTGHGDVPMAVDAFRKGVVDFVEKPLDGAYLLSRIDLCLALDRERRRLRRRSAALAARLATLSAREREVMEHVVAGRLNKQIADALDISIKTVEVHRSRVMEKMQAASVADLVRVSLELAGRG